MLRIIQLAALALALGALGCAGALNTEEFEKPPELVQQPYVIGAGDVLDVRVWKNEELSAEAAVRPDGMVSLPLIGDVVADGLTSEELTKVIAEKLSEYIANPDVFVGLRQSGSKRVYVIGEVQHGGPIPLASELRVMDVIAISGGFSPFADKGDVRIIRREGGQEREYTFDYDAYVSGDAPGTNVVLRPGDTVVVHD